MLQIGDDVEIAKQLVAVHVKLPAQARSMQFSERTIWLVRLRAPYACECA